MGAHSLSSIHHVDAHRIWNRAFFPSTDSAFGTILTSPLLPLPCSAANTPYLHVELFHDSPVVADRLFRKKGVALGNTRCTKHMVD